VALTTWLQVFETVSDLAQLSGRFRRAKSPTDPQATGGMLGQLETRLAGVVVAALKEAFDRDRVRMDLERAQFEAERRRAEEALRAELRRQAADQALGQVRLIAIMAIGVWMLSAALGVWMPGMRIGTGRWILGSGWGCALAALGCAFASWQRITVWSAGDMSDIGASQMRVSRVERIAPWLLLGAIALVGAALLIAL
jgi:hypothetical protein